MLREVSIRSLSVAAGKAPLSDRTNADAAWSGSNAIAANRTAGLANVHRRFDRDPVGVHQEQQTRIISTNECGMPMKGRIRKSGS